MIVSVSTSAGKTAYLAHAWTGLGASGGEALLVETTSTDIASRSHYQTTAKFSTPEKH